MNNYSADPSHGSERGGQTPQIQFQMHQLIRNLQLLVKVIEHEKVRPGRYRNHRSEKQGAK